MLRDLFLTADDFGRCMVSDAAILRVYLVCKEWAKRGRVQLTPMFEYHDRLLENVLRVPFVHHLEIVSPLMLVKRALRFACGHAAPCGAIATLRLHSSRALAIPESAIHVRLYAEGV
jgi:hypothetical protein